MIRLRLPSLRERCEDTTILARHVFTQSARQLDVEAKRLSPAAMHFLSQLELPGNVWPLENLCSWITVMAPGQTVEVKDLLQDLVEERPIGGPIAVVRRDGERIALAEIRWSRSSFRAWRNAGRFRQESMDRAAGSGSCVDAEHGPVPICLCTASCRRLANSRPCVAFPPTSRRCGVPAGRVASDGCHAHQRIGARLHAAGVGRPQCARRARYRRQADGFARIDPALLVLLQPQRQPDRSRNTR